MKTRRAIIALSSLTLVVALCWPAEAIGRRGPKSFLKSDDYKDGEEIIGVFLTDEEYGRMIEEVEFRDVEFDWTWYHADYRKPKKPTRLLFRIADCSPIRVPAVPNHSNALVQGVGFQVRERFALAMERLGLEVVEEGEARCELGVAVVDHKADGTYFFFGTADPFIELEIRLLDLETGQPLVLIRDQDHNSTPVEAAGDVASALMQALR